MRRGSKRRAGFTLIELLAAMAVLLTMVAIFGRIFTESSNAFNQGMGAADQNSTGRAVIDFMVREVSMMLADDKVSMRLYSDGSDDADTGVMDSFGQDPDSLYFASLNNDESSDLSRSIQQVGYRILPMRDENNIEMPYRYRLNRLVVRDADAVSYRAYLDDTWPDTMAGSSPALGSTVVENVRTLEFWVYDKNGVIRANYNSQVHGPPLFVDLYLEMFSEEDAIRVAAIAEAGNESRAEEIADKVVKRFAARVYLSNQNGYQQNP